MSHTGDYMRQIARAPVSTDRGAGVAVSVGSGPAGSAARD